MPGLQFNKVLQVILEKEKKTLSKEAYKIHHPEEKDRYSNVGTNLLKKLSSQLSKKKMSKNPRLVQFCLCR